MNDERDRADRVEDPQDPHDQINQHDTDDTDDTRQEQGVPGDTAQHTAHDAATHEPAAGAEPASGDRIDEADADDLEVSHETDAVQEELLARLRVADPAHDVEPTPGFVARVLAARNEPESSASPSTDEPDGEHVAAPLSSPTASPSSPDGEPPAVLDLAAARARRRHRVRTWVASGAAAALVGVAGYAVGAGGGASANDAAAPASALPAPISLGGAQAPGAEAARDSAGSATDSAGGSDAAIYPAFGRMVFTAPPGADLGIESATAYGLDARSATSQDAVAALAAALGVAGTPTLENGSWQVGGNDGAALQLWVNLDGTANFWYANGAFDPWSQCSQDVPTAPSDGADEEAWNEYNDAYQACIDGLTAALPAEDAAVTTLTDLLGTLGRDPADYVIAPTETYEGAVTRGATATRVVDGQSTQLAISVEITGDGLTYASGSLATPVAVGEYPIVSVDAAADRLNDPRFGPQNVMWPMAARDAAGADLPVTVGVPTPTEAPATPTETGAVPWPVTTVELVSVRLGLAQVWRDDGAVLLVPAYEFADANGVTYSVIAVADSDLDFTSAS
ncbi:hypothetical protein FH969_02110 [Miniimonas arenae]|uniref:Uncharacterized protein n=1 Tax=Miniimonas arenae TaxID=676201 RepID=A0A5C5BG49_9MICO|nr:hypothetical protein [Miniimonas arenae]TNU76695.1 hypothetical protein FH969_02110 [Miniimonas arenae]